MIPSSESLRTNLNSSKLAGVNSVIIERWITNSQFTSQLNGLVFKWMYLCLVKWSFFLNSFEQTSHGWLFSTLFLPDLFKIFICWLLVSLPFGSGSRWSFIFCKFSTTNNSKPRNCFNVKSNNYDVCCRCCQNKHVNTSEVACISKVIFFKLFLRTGGLKERGCQFKKKPHFYG